MTPIISLSTPLRAIFFFDGQNLYRQAMKLFGKKYNHPNYDPIKLSNLVCRLKGWKMEKIYFYTGVPKASDNALWNTFWTNKLLAMKRKGVEPFKGKLRYHEESLELYDGVTIKFPDGTILPITDKLKKPDGTDVPPGTELITSVGHEKGVDVRIAVDLIRLSHRNEYDVAVIFSQDHDLVEAVKEAKEVAAAQSRIIRVASAFPDAPGNPFPYPIGGTESIPISQADYDTCLDPRDYRK
jgi:uncharacterized LabA/DUF88 family protein